MVKLKAESEMAPPFSYPTQYVVAIIIHAKGWIAAIMLRAILTN
jgi:hypothetical protein